MIQVQINREKFMETFGALVDSGVMTDDALASIALTHGMGNDCFDISADGVAAPAKPAKRKTIYEGAPPKPRAERRPRAAKETSDLTIEVAARIVAYLAKNPGARPATMEVDASGNEIKDALKFLVKEGKVRSNGKKGAGSGYYLVERIVTQEADA